MPDPVAIMAYNLYICKTILFTFLNMLQLVQSNNMNWLFPEAIAN